LKLIPTKGGKTFSIYNEIPTYALKGQSFFKVTHKKTRTFEDQTEFLNSLGMVLNIEMQTPVLISELKTAEWKTFGFQNGYFICNHIPQLYQLTKYGYITDIQGEYSWRNQLFKGEVTFSDDIKTGGD
jgi:hypothetical protein